MNFLQGLPPEIIVHHLIPAIEGNPCSQYNSQIKTIVKDLFNFSEVSRSMYDLINPRISHWIKIYKKNLISRQNLHQGLELKAPPEVLNVIKNCRAQIHMAIAVENIQQLDVLLKSDQDINILHLGLTPLSFAVKLNHIECVKKLLLHPSIELKAQNKDGTQAIDHASTQQMRDLLKNIEKIRP